MWANTYIFTIGFASLLIKLRRIFVSRYKKTKKKSLMTIRFQTAPRIYNNIRFLLSFLDLMCVVGVFMRYSPYASIDFVDEWYIFTYLFSAIIKILVFNDLFSLNINLNITKRRFLVMDNHCLNVCKNKREFHLS
jgi:hypothetical protein